MAAARDIDDIGALGQHRERLRVQDAARLRRQRQQADQEIADCARNASNSACARIALDAVDRLARAAPARHRKAQIAQALAGHGADLAKAQDADARVLGACAAASSAPISARRLRGVEHRAAWRCCISTCITTYCAISVDSCGSTKRTSGTCLGNSGSVRNPSTPAPSENTAFRFGSVFSNPGGGRKLST